MSGPSRLPQNCILPLCGLALSILFFGVQPVAAAESSLGSPRAVDNGPASIQIAGNTLTDGTGRPVVLHGVDVSGTEFACAQGGVRGNEGWSIFGGQPIDSTTTIQAIRSWHVNAVRVPLNEDCWLGINGISPRFGGASYVAAIRRFVGDLRSQGMFVILDLHWNAPGDAVALSQQPMADADHSLAFWSDVASRFRSDPGVVFDLYNEPFLYASYMQNSSQNAWSCWLNGCMLNQYLTGGHPYTRPLTWRVAGMQQMIDAVRATGAKNLVISNGLDWANDDSGWLTHRPMDPAKNLAAGWHEYGGETCSNLKCWSGTIAPLAQKVPVIVGETGDHAGTGCTLTNMPMLLPWADSMGISYLAWTFNPWHDSHDVLITDWSGTPTQCEGQYYSQHLATIASNPPSIQQQAPPRPVVVAGIRPDVGLATRIIVIMLAIAVCAWGVFITASVLLNRRRVMQPNVGEMLNSIDSRSTDLRLVRALTGSVGAIAILVVLILLYAPHLVG